MSGLEEIVEALWTSRSGSSGNEDERDVRFTGTALNERRGRGPRVGKRTSHKRWAGKSFRPLPKCRPDSVSPEPRLAPPPPPPPQQDHQARFTANDARWPRSTAKSFLKKCGKDLNTALIFVGLFSVVASAFIIQVNRGLQLDTDGWNEPMSPSFLPIELNISSANAQDSLLLFRGFHSPASLAIRFEINHHSLLRPHDRGCMWTAHRDVVVYEELSRSQNLFANDP
ncbi:hypothetical protein BJ322DRAFT_676771 [Thelephora terrestris]|uniref:DUF6535 domain-containing protein n=1 Tax=Thelephora terrestris TaxID=56493 RepID=A0A9P6HHC9_9AGAM|nr:hypothetical protein BJ322DRAFT_676771 [Thelephora terrestris]